ncbi:protein-L-isoaspartate(D-aspartate) O-methyltransferase [Halogranum amylolyticum]|uniref:Protein-L-isoaspartate O-methyltransferase n=1 Tax=Halogranum amylolyticum TaxID=660520 RepID=A0A1H8VY98_9EURY|nr:protein-L-isoaspartate(D-aspartate) O-methyltransferase [Halogranum amylolyticum]SEP20325.1 protein-L-isoaspartate(D-aspartate) O-methyltransferase [Halogranum amylolyticum]
MDTTAARRRLVDGLVSRGAVDRDATADALRAVPRHEFLPEERRDRAYVDRPLPIAAGQTVSAPHMVAMMTDLLELSPGDRVLEIGTGCGYHAAVTAEVVGATTGEDAEAHEPTGRVFSVEYHEELAERARRRLDRLGYAVSVRVGDGHDGWPEHAPYDAAYLTCAPAEIPRAVVEQVRPEGVVVGPIGGAGRQRLVRLRRRPDGTVEREDHGGVRFVPMQSD